VAQSLIERAWRATSADELENDLAGLWREIAQQQVVARAVMSNLLVVRTGTSRDPAAVDALPLPADLSLNDVVARHPSRVIVIEHDHAPKENGAPSELSVGVVTFGPPQARYGVEEIVVHSACSEQSLPSIVRRLLRGDVPTSIWWIDDLSESQPVDALVSMARQLIYDSRTWSDVRRGVQGLATLRGRLDLADVNWRRLTPLRHAFIHAGEAADAEHLRQASVRIVHRVGEEALAWLTVGWLSAQLRWSADRLPRIEASPAADPTISISVGTDLTAELNDYRVLVMRGGATSFAVGVPQVSDADAVAAELRNLGHDTCLQDALGALVERFRG
jgi:glucose-6-phosphate dehydrogenase assembly protein OpcA